MYANKSKPAIRKGGVISPTKKFLYTFLPLFFALIYFQDLKAEGTKEIRPASGDNGYVVLDPAWSPFALYGCPSTSRIHITICNPGEKIFYGFRQAQGDVRYRIKNAAGTIIVPQATVPTSGAGFISSYARAFNGPSQIVGAIGYNALTYIAPAAGDYYIEFLLPSGSPRRDFEYFDITVATAANVKINGRVWSQSWMFSTRNYGRPFKGKLFIYADDGIVTSLDFNGMDPYVFVLNANQTGTGNTGNPNQDRRSRVGSVTYPRYKVFLNDPDENCFPTGQFGDLVSPTSVTGCPPANFCINVFPDRPGRAEVLLDLNGTIGYQAGTIDRVLSQDVSPPSTCISWDGRDGLGNFVSSGTNITVKTEFYNGLTHIPLFDVERNPNGYIVQLVRPTTAAVPKLFWDDTNIPAAAGNTNFTGCTSPCHTWNWACCSDNSSSDYGNRNTINTWWYADSTSRQETFFFPAGVFVDAETRNGAGTANDTLICGNMTSYALSGNILNATGGQWTSTGTGTFSPNSTALNATYNITAADQASGLLRLILTSTGNGSCPASRDTLIIRFQSPPTANAGADISVCANNAQATLNGIVTNAGGGIWSSSGTGTFSPINTALNATYTPSAADTAAGTVTLTLSTTGNNRCVAATDQKIITIQDAPAVNAGPAQTVCGNNPDITLAGSVANATSHSWSGGTGAFSPNNTNLNATYTPSAGEIAAGTVSLTLTANRTGCNSVQSLVTFTIPPAPTVNAGPDQAVCNNNATITLAGSVTNTTNQTWTGGSGTFTPNANTLNATYEPTLTERNSGSIILTLTAGEAGCSVISDPVTISFTNSPSVEAGASGTVCANNPSFAISGASFTGATGILWSGGGGTFVPNATTLNPQYTPSAAERTLGISALILTTTGNGSCNAAKDTILLVIQPAPTANAGPNQTVCANNPNVTLAGSATNGSFSWSGGTGTYSPNSATLNAVYTPSANEISAGTVTLTLTASRSGCIAVSSSTTITIAPAPTVNAGSDQSVCYNNSATTLNGSSTLASGIVWSGGSGTFNPNNTSVNAQYTPTLTERNTGTVTLTITSTGNGTCNAVNDQMAITITPAPTANANSDQTVCANNPNVVLNGSISVATSSTWSGGGSFSPNANALNATYTPSASEITAGTATLTLTTTNNGNCSPVSDQMNITITPAPIANAGADRTVCADNPEVPLAGSVSVAAGGTWTGGAGTYNPNNTTLNATYTPTIAEINTGMINLILTSMNNGNCNAVNDQMTLNITPAPTVSAGSNQTVCGNTNAVSLNGTVTGSTGGQWTTSGTGTFTPNATNLNTTYRPSAADKTNGTVTLTLTTTGNGLCNAMTDQMDIVFNPVSSINAGPNQIVCISDMPVQLNGSGSPATWSGGNGTFSPNANTLNATYTPSATELASGSINLTLTTLANGACPIVSDQVRINTPPGPRANAGGNKAMCGNGTRVTLNGSVTNATGGSWTTTGTGSFSNPNSPNTDYDPSVQDINAGSVLLKLITTGNGVCSSHLDEALVNITPGITVNAGPDQTICADLNGFILNGSITGVSGGTWTSSGSGTFNPNANALNATYVPSGTDKAAGTVTLTLTTASNGNCGSLSDNVTYTITPAPTVSAGPDQSICADAVNVTLNGSLTIATGAEWSSSGTGIFTPGNTGLNPTYVPSVADQSSGTITLTISTTGNGTCNAVSDQMTLTINAAPTINAGADQTVCVDAGSVNLNGSVTISTGGIWSSNGNGTFTPNANTLNAAYTLSPLDISNGIVTLTLTSNGNGTCNAVSDQMIITINPAPTVNAGADRNVCANNSSIVLNGSITVATGGIWSGGSGTFSPNNTTLNATYTPTAAEISGGTIALTLTTTGNGLCNSVADQMNITITPAPTADAGADQTICADNIAVSLSGAFTVSSGGTWSTSGTGTFFPSNNTSNATYSPSATDRTNGFVNLTFTTTSNGTCSPVSDQMTITITPAPTVDAGPNQTVCGNNSNIALHGTVTIASGGVWTTSGTGTFGNSNLINTTYTPSAIDKSAGTVTLTLTTTGNGTCNAVTDQLTVSITPTPTVNAGADQSVCANNAAVPLNGSLTIATGGLWTSSGTGTFAPSTTALTATYNPSIADQTTGTITLTLTSTGNGLCNPVSDQMIVTITPSPTVNAGADQTICADATGVTLSGSKTIATGSIWTTDGTGTFSPDATNLNATYRPSAADTAAHTILLTLTTTGNNTCNAINDQLTVTITPAPTINAGPDETICADIEFLNLSGIVTTASGGIWTTSGNGTFSPDATMLNAQYFPSASDRTGNSISLTLTSTGNGTCSPVSDQKTITINPMAGINAGSDQTVCANNPDVQLNGSVTIASGGTWISSGDGSFSPNENTLNATYTPSANDISIGSVVLTLETTGNGACYPVSDQVILTITPSPAVDAGMDQSVCANNPAVSLNGAVATASGGIWTSNGSGTFAPNALALNAVYHPSSADTSAGSVILTLTSTGNGNCNAETDQLIVTITDAPTVNPGTNQTVCANTSGVILNGIVSVASGGTWSTSSGTGTFTPDANTLNASFVPSAQQIANGRANLTLTTSGNGNCAPVSATMVITIQAVPSANAGADIEICAGTPSIPLQGTVTNASGGTWSVSTGGSGTFNPNANTLNASYTPSVAENINGNIVTLTFASTGNGSCAPASDQVTITFNTIPVNAGPDQTVCSNSLPVTLNGSGSGSWSGGAGTFNDPNALNTTYTPDPTEIPGVITLTLSTAIGFCSGSDEVEITILNGPTADAGSNQTKCANNAVVTLAGVISNASGQTWNTEGTGIFNAGFTTYTPSTTDITSGSVILSITTTGNGTCNPASDTMIVTFTPAPVVDAGPNQAVCSNGGAISLNGSTNMGTATWSLVSGSGTFDDASQVNTTYNAVPSDTLAGTITLRLSSTLAGCGPVSDDMNITFGSSPTANAGTDETVCADISEIILNGSVSIASGGNWTTSGSGTFTPNSNTLNAAYVPSPGDITTGIVTLTITTTGNGTCNAASNQMTLTITQAPTVNVGPNQTLCADIMSVSINGTRTVATGSNWMTTGTGTFDNANALSTSYNPSPADKAAGNVNLTLTTTGNGTCNAVSSTLSILLTPAPTVHAGPDQTGCNDVLSYTLNPIITVATGGSWTSSGTGTFTDPGAFNTSYSPSPADTTAGSVTLTLTTTTGNGTCNAVNDQLTLTFTDAPAVNAGTDGNTCADKDSIVLNGSVSGASGGTWASSGTGSFAPNAAALNATYYMSATDKTSGAITLTLNSTGNGTCNTVSDQVSFTIDPKPSVNAGVDQTICAGQANASLNGTVLNAAGATWTSTGTGTFTDPNSLITTYNPSASDNTLGGIILTLTSTGTATCNAVSDLMVINVIPAPSALVNAGFDQTVCRDISSVQLNGFIENAGGGLWSSPGTGTFSPDANALDASYIPSAADKALPSITLTLITTNNGICSAVTDNVIISFTPAPTVDANMDQNICGDMSGVALLNGTVTVATGAIWSTSGTGFFSPDAITLNATYFPSAADKIIGSVGLTLTTTGNGTCNPVNDAMLVRIRKAPVINAGTDISICANTSSVSVSASVSPATAAIWTSSGTGTFADPTSLNTSYSPSSADTSSGAINLTVTTISSGAFGSCAPVSDQVKISFNNSPTVNAGPDQTICADASVALTGIVTNASGGIWTTSGGGSFSNPNSLNALYTPSETEKTAGLATLTLTNTGNAVCSATSDQVVITIQPRPIVNAGSAQVCVLSEGALLNGTFSNATGIVWSSNGTGVFSPNAFMQNARYYPSAEDVSNGPIILTITSSGNGSCAPASHSTTLTLDPVPVAYGGRDQDICSGSSTTLSAHTSPGVSYNWSTPTGVTISTSPLATITANSDTSFVLTVTDPKGCISRDTVRVRVYNLPTFTMSPNNCYSDTLIVNSNPLGLPAVPGVFQWFRNGSIMTGENRSVISVSDQGSYSIVYSYGNCSVSASTAVTIPPVLRTMKLLDCENSSSLITITSNVSGVNYNWPTQGQSGVDLSSITVNVPADTSYIPAIVTDALGCSSKDSVLVIGIPTPVLTLTDINTCEGNIELLDGRPDNISNLDAYNPTWEWKRNNTLLASTSDSLAVSSTGIYSLIVKIGQCASMDTSTVAFNPNPIAALPEKLKFCKEPLNTIEIVLDAGSGTGNTYYWTASSGILLDSNNTRTIGVRNEGTYTVTVTNGFNCPTTDSIFVDELCPPRVHVPTAFIPGTNTADNTFKVFGDYFINYQMLVFNRWGEVIFMSRDRNEGWDGRYLGKPMPVGIYPWIVTYEGEDPEMKGPFKQQGSVTIVR